jgi:hypothetical protein
MPTKLTPDKIRSIFTEIDISKAWRKEKEEEWDKNIGYLKGEFYDDPSELDRVCVNMVYPHVRVVIPAIYSRNPDITINPQVYGDNVSDLAYKRAEILQRVMKYYIRELGIKGEVKLCLLDAILTGMAWIKLGYETEFTDDSVEDTKETIISKILKFTGIKQGEDEEEFQPNEKIVNERMWALRVSPYDIFVPALSRRPEELYKIWERIILPYDMVMENKDYDTTGLKPSTNANELLASLRGFKGKNLQIANDSKFVVLYECWDGMSGEMYTIAEGFDKPLEQKETGYNYLDSRYHPYISLRFNEIVDEFYPSSDIKPAEPQMLELNEARTQMTIHRKRYNRRYITRPGAFDPQAVEALKLGEDATVLEHTPTYADTPLADIIQPITDAALPAEIYQTEKRVKDDIYNILGTMDYASQGNGARTATEASIIATQSKYRVDERIDIVGEFVERIIRGLAQIAQYHMDQDKVEPILGMDAVYWRQVQDRDILRGEYSYKVMYGSSAPVNREVEKQQFMQFYSLARNDPYFNQVMLRLQLARKFDLENPESWLVPQIINVIEQQRMAAAKKGLLLETSQDALGTTQPPGMGVQSQSQEKLPTGQPRGLPGDTGAADTEPSIPGGKGGTQLASAGY